MKRKMILFFVVAAVAGGMRGADRFEVHGRPFGFNEVPPADPTGVGWSRVTIDPVAGRGLNPRQPRCCQSERRAYSRNSPARTVRWSSLQTPFVNGVSSGTVTGVSAS